LNWRVVRPVPEPFEHREHQVPEVVMDTLKFLETQCGTPGLKVRVLRTDRGSEYVNRGKQAGEINFARRSAQLLGSCGPCLRGPYSGGCWISCGHAV
jgi:hypothetical protein